MTPLKRTHDALNEAFQLDPPPVKRSATLSRSASQLQKSLLERLEALFQKVHKSRDYARVKIASDEAFAIFEGNGDAVKGNAEFKKYRKQFLFFWPLSVYALKERRHLDKALERLKELRQSVPDDKASTVDLLKAKILSLRNHPGIDDDPCDACIAVDVLEKSSGGTDKVRGQIHRKLASLFEERVQDGHTGCFSDSSTEHLSQERTQPLEDDKQAEDPEEDGFE